MNNEEIASRAVDAIFDDLRDRRFLKWLFKEEETVIGDFVGLQSLDLKVQMEIRQAWCKIISVALAARKGQIMSDASRLAEMLAQRARKNSAHIKLDNVAYYTMADVDLDREVASLLRQTIQEGTGK